jgi:hypothetical protein
MERLSSRSGKIKEEEAWDVRKSIGWSNMEIEPVWNSVMS